MNNFLKMFVVGFPCQDSASPFTRAIECYCDEVGFYKGKQKDDIAFPNRQWFGLGLTYVRALFYNGGGSTREIDSALMDSGVKTNGVA